jgi:ribonuclease M5
MIHISQAILVEGKYDVNVLSQIVDAPIFRTDGFGIMNNQQMLVFLRKVVKERGLIILTDSDGAGFVIRNFLRGALPTEGVYHAYIPEIPGKERRKTTSGKEGLLGVEGMSPELIIQAIQRCGIQVDDQVVQREEITKADFCRCGLAGVQDAERNRKLLCERLGLPGKMSANALLKAVNILYSRETFLKEFEHD